MTEEGKTCYHCNKEPQTYSESNMGQLTIVYFPDERLIQEKEDETIARLYCDQCVADFQARKFDPSKDPSFVIGDKK